MSTLSVFLFMRYTEERIVPCVSYRPLAVTTNAPAEQANDMQISLEVKESIGRAVASGGAGTVGSMILYGDQGGAVGQVALFGFSVPQPFATGANAALASISTDVIFKIAEKMGLTSDSWTKYIIAAISAGWFGSKFLAGLGGSDLENAVMMILYYGIGDKASASYYQSPGNLFNP